MWVDSQLICHIFLSGEIWDLMLYILMVWCVLNTVLTNHSRKWVMTRVCDTICCKQVDKRVFMLLNDHDSGQYLGITRLVLIYICACVRVHIRMCVCVSGCACSYPYVCVSLTGYLSHGRLLVSALAYSGSIGTPRRSGVFSVKS